LSGSRQWQINIVNTVTKIHVAYDARNLLNIGGSIKLWRMFPLRVISRLFVWYVLSSWSLTLTNLLMSNLLTKWNVDFLKEILLTVRLFPVLYGNCVPNTLTQAFYPKQHIAL
jgi:hypothetical protein